jgi:hypothetical protein
MAQAMASGTSGLDRAAALVKLRSAGVSPELFTEAAGKYSLGRLYGLLARLSQISPVDESDGFEWRYLVIQPSLDESVFKLWGQLPESTAGSSRRLCPSGKPNFRSFPTRDKDRGKPTP